MVRFKNIEMYFETIMASLAIALGTYVFVSAIILVINTSTSLPISDQWGEILTGRPFSFAWLFSQHFEHRILFPRLLFYVDDIVFSETNEFNYTTNMFLQTILAISVASIAAYRSYTRGITFVWALGVVFATLFWAMQQ